VKMGRGCSDKRGVNDPCDATGVKRAPGRRTADNGRHEDCQPPSPYHLCYHTLRTCISTMVIIIIIIIIIIMLMTTD
jgi:hypothetical protein